MDYIKLTERQFNKVLEREGQVITNYYSNENYKVFFRKTNRGDGSQEKLRIYYPQSYNIAKGTIIIYKGTNYLIENQDASESNIYYTSVAVKCVETFPVQYNNKKYNVPIVVVNSNYKTSSSITITVISGSLICYTGLNDISRSITLNKIFVKFGGTYSVQNYFFNDNMAYFYLTRETNQPDKNELNITADKTTCETGTTSQIVANCLTNDEVVLNQTITYTSSDETLATVNANGVLTFIKAGTVIITGTWTEKQKTNTLTYNVVEPEKPVASFTITQKISGNIIINGRARTITATVTNGDGTVNTTEPLTWGFTYPVGFESLFVTTNPTNRTYTIKCGSTDDYDKLIGKTVDVSIKDTATGTATSIASYKITMS